MPISEEYKALPPREAIAFLAQKLNLPTRRWTDILRSDHDKAFVVAGAMKMELLADLRAAVEEALQEGISLGEFRKRFDQAVQKYGWAYNGGRGWRTQTIYRTNLSTAYAAGRRAQQLDPEVLEARPLLMYRHGDSIVPREQHLRWDGLVLPADDPWWDTHYPPNGFGCSCSAFSLSQADVDERGLSVAESAPDDGTYEWVHPQTGEVMDVPVGVAPGWDYAPGAGWQAALQRQAERAPYDLARLYVADVVEMGHFARWLDEPGGTYPVGVLSPELQRAVQAKEKVVVLSDDTLAKQRRVHPELDVDEYRLLPAIVDGGEVIQDGERTLVFLERFGRLYVAAVKSTATGRGLFLTSFRRANQDELARQRSKGRTLRRG